MKTIESITYKGATLTVYATIQEMPEGEQDRAYIEYFINGYEVKKWSEIKKVYQDLFTVLADDICQCMCAVKGF